MSKVTLAIGAAKLALSAKAPTLLVVGGVASMGAAVVVACKRTLVFNDVLAVHTSKIDEMKDAAERGALKVGGKPYTETNFQHDKGVVYQDIAYAALRSYAVPGVLFIGGAVMVFRGHHILQQRNAALAVAFTTLKRSFDSYRSRVVAREGHEADQHYLYGSQQANIARGGKTEIVATRDWDASNEDPYNRVFSQATSSQWQNDLGANRHFVAEQQRFAQQLLNRQGYLYLSTAYKALGLEQNDTSRICGWKITTLPDGTRDIPVVDFGIDKPIADDWKYNQRKEVYLDFNCQGLIVGGKVQKALEAL